MYILVRDVDKSCGARPTGVVRYYIRSRSAAEICNLIRCRAGFYTVRHVVVEIVIYFYSHIRTVNLGRVRSNGNLLNELLEYAGQNSTTLHSVVHLEHTFRRSDQRQKSWVVPLFCVMKSNQH